MEKITFLGPVGATFSHDAYDILAKLYSAPQAVIENCLPAASNGEILGLIAKHGGYGAIAMETLAEGRVAEPLESFIDLLKMYKKMADCPFRVAGAIQLKIHFCLMARPEVSLDLVKKVIAHPKSLGACKKRIASMGIEVLDVLSNGEAARIVAEREEHVLSSALGPRSAAEKYNLRVLHDAFEDGEAVTTFFLVAPANSPIVTGEKNRILIVFKVPHEPNALVKSLQPFGAENLNLIQIHSMHVGNHTYNFAIEVEVKRGELLVLERAMREFKEYVEEHLVFGPFQVLSR